MLRKCHVALEFFTLFRFALEVITQPRHRRPVQWTSAGQTSILLVNNRLPGEYDGRTRCRSRSIGFHYAIQLSSKALASGYSPDLAGQRMTPPLLRARRAG
jgi:hypothetical protein